MKFNFIKYNSGQSLVEILVALAVGIIFVLGTIIAVQMSLKTGKDSEKIQTSAMFARELMDNVKIFAESDWHNISNLATTSANKYYLNTSNSPFTAVSGEESISVGTTTYSRYFYVDDVYRDGSGQITQSGGTLDPSTKKITIVYKWIGGNDKYLITYLTRFKNMIFNQTDWSGGGGQNGPITSTNEKFATSSNILFDEKGKIYLNLNLSPSFFIKVIDGETDQRILSISPTSDGGYIAGGDIMIDYNTGNRDGFLVKFDSSGNIEFERFIGGSNIDSISSIFQTSDGYYVAGGYTQSFGAGYYDGFIIKLNSSGNVVWAKTIGGTAYDRIYSIFQNSNDEYIAGGDTMSYLTEYIDHSLLIKLDSSGNITNCSDIRSINLGSLSTSSSAVSTSSSAVSISSPTIGNTSTIQTITTICPI